MERWCGDGCMDAWIGFIIIDFPSLTHLGSLDINASFSVFGTAIKSDCCTLMTWHQGWAERALIG